MTDRRHVAVAGTLGLFVATELLAVALAGEFRDAGITYAPGGPTGGGGAAASPLLGLGGLVPIVLGVALGTLLVLGIVHYDLDPRLVRLLMIGSLSAALALVFVAVARVSLGVGLGLAAVVASVVWIHPEWYVLDAVVLVAVAGVAGLLGTSLGPFAALVALVSMAAYDAYSVYGSGHMLTLADSAAAMGAPTMFVVPTERGATTADVDGVAAAGEPTGPVAFLGAGDALFPGLFVVAALGVGAPVVGPLTIPAVGALLGSVTGLLGLQWWTTTRGGVHAGLPPLSAGTLGGYLAGVLLAGVPVVSAVGF